MLMAGDGDLTTTPITMAMTMMTTMAMTTPTTVTMTTMTTTLTTTMTMMNILATVAAAARGRQVTAVARQPGACRQSPDQRADSADISFRNG